MGSHVTLNGNSQFYLFLWEQLIVESLSFPNERAFLLGATVKVQLGKEGAMIG